METRLLIGDSTLARAVYAPSAEVSVIVQFDAPSLASVRADARDRLQKTPIQAMVAAQSALESQYAQFQADVARLESEARRGGHPTLGAADTEVRHHYMRVLNGVALSAPRWLADEIAGLPYVERVAEDQTWQLEDPKPTAAVSYRPAAEEYGVTGEGIVVGVVDTGIDYTRADLGGGIGPDYKVIGGFDFVNEDEDPMDDNFHGTAVAGVIAAEGEEYQGVAPDVRLMALKACNSGGQCRVSHIIAAIEHAVDPDKDVTTDDAVDVLNLSLGSPSGDAFSPASVAIDGAVTSGTVCVVSAGNAGFLSYHSVGHIAAARKAITVGAIQGDFDVAYFSSRGPTRREYAIKPEILAPGFAVKAPLLGGEYAAYDGTSFSAPYVAGVVAMMLEKQPDWSPELLKSALVQTSDDLGFDVWAQGFGRVHIEKALNQTSLVSPSTLALGLVDTAHGSWTASKMIELHNHGETTSIFNLSVEAPFGMTAVFEQAVITLEPGTSQTVDVQIDVDPASLADNDVTDEEWLPYTGAVIAESATEQLVVPFSVVKSPYLRIESDLPFGFMIVHDRETFETWNVGANVYGEDLTFLLPNGSYDVMYNGDREYIVRENVAVEGARTLNLETSLAMHTYEAHLRDENGAPVSVDGMSFRGYFQHAPTGITFGSSGYAIRDADGVLDYRFSDIEGPYRYEWHAWNNDQNAQRYHFRDTHDTFDADRAFVNDPNKLRHITYEYRTNQDADAIWPLIWESIPGVAYSIAASWHPEASLLHEPFSQETYVVPDSGDDFWKQSGIFQEVLIPENPPATYRDQARLLYLTPELRVTGSGDIEASLGPGSHSSILSIPGDKITYGLGPSHWFARFENSTDRVRLKTNSRYGIEWATRINGTWERFVPFFLNQLQDAPPLAGLRYKLLDESGQTVAGGLFSDRLQSVAIEQDECCFTFPVNDETFAALTLVDPAPYTLVVTDSSYTIGGVRGRATVRASMDLRLDDRNPPNMTSLNVMSEGEYTDGVSVNEEGELRFQVGDIESDVSATLLIREPGHYWTEAPLQRKGPLFTTVLSDAVPHGHYDARVLVEDAAGNALDFMAVPAFRRVDPDPGTGPPGSPVPIYPDEEAVNLLPELTMTWRSAPEAAEHRLHLSSDERFEEVLVDTTISDTSLALSLERNRHYYWRVRGLNDEGASPWSTGRMFATTVSTAIEELADEIPATFAVEPNYPNPFNPATTIGFSLPERTPVKLEIFNALGQRVATLVDEELPAGRFRYTWDASGLPSGVYVYRVATKSHSHTATGVLIK